MTRIATPAELGVKIFADGAEIDGIRALCSHALVRGFTTNPSLMRKAGVDDYRRFALDVLRIIGDRPLSLEVFADTFDEMERQAHEIASWGSNVYVKIPVTNTAGRSACPLIERLSAGSVKVNVTALLTLDQVRDVTSALAVGTPSVISVFAGRIADTGIDPVPVMRDALEIMRAKPLAELLWASPRELLNIVQAHAIGCHIITVNHDLLKKLPLIGKDLRSYSLETVKMFFDDAQAASYSITTASEAA